MGDVGETFQVFDDIKRENRAKKEPSRFKYAEEQLSKIPVTFMRDHDVIHIYHSKGQIDLWPFTGWFCGRKPLGNIKGRGIDNLIRKLKVI